MPIATESWYNFETHTFQDTAPDLNFVAPPDKMTQEEWRYVKIIAETTGQWWRIRRTSPSLSNLGGTNSINMKQLYDTIKAAHAVARIFGSPRRVDVLTEYAKKNYRAALFYASEEMK